MLYASGTPNPQPSTIMIEPVTNNYIQVKRLHPNSCTVVPNFNDMYSDMQETFLLFGANLSTQYNVRVFFCYLQYCEAARVINSHDLEFRVPGLRRLLGSRDIISTPFDLKVQVEIYLDNEIISSNLEFTYKIVFPSHRLPTSSTKIISNSSNIPRPRNYNSNQYLQNQSHQKQGDGGSGNMYQQPYGNNYQMNYNVHSHTISTKLMNNFSPKIKDLEGCTFRRVFSKSLLECKLLSKVKNLFEEIVSSFKKVELGIREASLAVEDVVYGSWFPLKLKECKC